jgi:phage-related protein
LEENLAAAHLGIEKCTKEAALQVKAVAVESTAEVKLLVHSGVAEIVSASAAARGEIVGLFSGISKQVEHELKQVKSSAKAAAATLSSVTNQFEHSTLDAQKSLGEALAAWVSEVQKTAGSIGQGVAAQMEQSFAKVGQASGELADSVAKAVQRLEGVRLDKIDQALGEAQMLISDRFRVLAEKVAGLGAQLQAAFPSGSEYREAFANLSTSLSEAVKENRAAMKQMQTAANETGAAFGRVGEVLKSAGSAMGIDDLRISVQKLANVISAHRTSIGAAGGTLVQVSGNLSQVAHGVALYAKEVENLAAEFRREIKDIGQLRHELSEVRQGMTEDLMSSQEILRIVMNTLSEGVRQLRREIDSFGA